MDPLTHALTAVALGRAGLNKLTRIATPMLIVSGTIADVDWITRLGSASAYLHGHRTATHSLLGTIAIILGVSTAFWLAGRKFPKLGVEFRPAMLVCAVGAGAHLLMDLLNSYGVKLLWPFSSKWYAWDLVDSIDAWILFFLLCGLLVPELFRLILGEIGAKPGQSGRQRGAIASLVLILLFVAGRAFEHARAIALLDSRQYAGQTPIKTGAFPQPSNPLAWHGVVETDNAVVTLDAPLGPFSAFDPDQANVFFKPEQSPPLKSAVSSATAADFLNYARFPLANIAPEDHGYVVRLRDMRFESELPRRNEIIAVIHLNEENVVTAERLEFDADPSR